MQIGLFAESAGMNDFDAVLARMSALGMQWIELSTGGQDDFPYLDAPKLLKDKKARQELTAKLDGHGLKLSAINASAFPLHPTIGADHTELIRNAIRLAG